jgi:pimeloyl-ACP methyl ester carboxylesterase
MQVIVDDLLVNYELDGNGKTLVLLHGWGDSSKGLIEFRRRLSKSYQVITPDLPGFGASQVPKEVWGLADYANFVSKFIAKLKLKDVEALIGHSNGGAIAIKSLSTGVVSSNSLVLLASAGIRGDNKGRLKTLKLTTKAGKIILTPFPSKLKSKIRRKLYTSIGSDMLVAEHLSETFKRVVSEDIREDANRLNLPTLLIYGEQDSETPISQARLLHELINDSTLEILGNAGHFVHKDKTDSVVKLIEDFIE